MSAISLMYHDILVDACRPDDSGFKGPGPAVYKIGLERFKQHLELIASFPGQSAAVISEESLASKNAVFLTFDDGGRGAMNAADALEAYGFRGHFFVTTDYINQNGFLTEDQIRQLHQRGHLIGSHSCSHPQRMNALSEESIQSEWRNSVEALTRILDAPVCTASVPAGYYSKRVATAAEMAGIRYLFTSEPIRKITYYGECAILGRYAITTDTPKSLIERLLSQKFFAGMRQLLWWKVKSGLKIVGGDVYIAARKKLLTLKPK